MSTISSKPKFALELSINDINNIPHVGGRCFVELSIRDSKKHKLGSHTITNASANKESTSVSGIVASTKEKPIQNYKCVFNYNLSCNLKFSLKKKDNLIGNKYCLLRVYYKDDIHQSNKPQEVGYVDVNLSEYLNFNEPTTSKYLLQNSKVNAIISVTISLVELPANMEFHTQLKTSELSSSKLSKRTTNFKTKSSMTNLNGTFTSNGKFNVPNFERNKVFGGFNDIIENKSDQQSILHSDSSISDTDKSGTDSHRDKQENGSHRDVGSHSSKHHHMHLQQMITQRFHQHNDSTKNSLANQNQNQNQNLIRLNGSTSQVIMEPMVMNLYKKILEATWDPELYKLLDYSPQNCIDSIFNGDDKWKKLLQKDLGKWEEEDEDKLRDLNGLINEIHYRENLKSWHVQS